jgi:hypothetical protein
MRITVTNPGHQITGNREDGTPPRQIIQFHFKLISIKAGHDGPPKFCLRSLKSEENGWNVPGALRHQVTSLSA